MTGCKYTKERAMITNRKQLKVVRYLIATVLLAASAVLHASQEGIFPIGSMRIESASVGDWGAVAIDIKQDDKGMQRFGVQAFGRSYLLSAAQLRELEGVMYNAIQISREAGYAEREGRTIYVKLGVGFTSGQVSRVKYVVVTEAGAITVKDQLQFPGSSR
jgi:hypothetical protein